MNQYNIIISVSVSKTGHEISYPILLTLTLMLVLCCFIWFLWQLYPTWWWPN